MIFICEKSSQRFAYFRLAMLNKRYIFETELQIAHYLYFKLMTVAKTSSEYERCLI